MEDDQVRQLLAEEQERLESLRQEYAGIRDESETDAMHELSSVNQHQADIGSETFEREKDLTILDEIEGELADIEHALRRLDEGTYGTCEACGKAIPDERLEAMPATRYCVDDQAAAERESRAAAASGDT